MADEREVAGWSRKSDSHIDRLTSDPYGEKGVFERARLRARDAALTEPAEDKPLSRDEERKAWEAKRAADKEKWQNHGRSSHVPLDEKTLAARAAWYAEKGAAKNSTSTTEPQAYMLDEKTYQSVVQHWINVNVSAGNWWNSAWNFEQLANCLSDHIQRGAHFTYSLLDEIFAELKAAGHLENRPGPRIRGQFVLRSSPVPYTRQETTPAEREELAQQQQTAEEAEVAAAKSMPLDELKRRMRAQFRDARPLDVRGGR